MSTSSPEAVLYDIDGSPLAVDNGVPYPSDTPLLISGGSDGTNARYMLVDSSGRQVMVGAGVAGTPTGGVVSIQGVAGGTAVPISGTITASGTVTANQGTPNTIGNSWPVEMTDGTNILGTAAHPVRIDPTGTTTQPVSGTVTANAGSGNFAVVQATAANLNATVVGTVTANIGTTNGLALDATLTGGTQRTKITDGTNNAAVKAASTAAATTDPALVVAISPNNSVAVTGTVTVTQGTAANLRAQTASEFTTATATGTIASLTGGAVTTAAPTYTTGQMNPLSLTTTGLLRIDGSGVTQPVSGTVTANAGTGTFTVAGTVAATQSGSWTVTANAGTGSFTVAQATAANLNATVVGTTAAGSGAASGLITVQGNASGTPIPVSGTVTATNPSVSTTGTAPPASATYIGGSVTTAAPTYTTGQMNALSLTTGGLLRVDGSGVTQPVSGTVTANAGTGTFTVAGTVTANAGTGNFTVVQATASNLNATVVQSTAANLRTQTASESTTATTTGTVANLIGGAVTTAAPTYTTGQMDPLSLTTTGLLRVDGSGVTQPVSGTVTANAGTGTFTVAGTVTANAGTGNFTVTQATAANLNATVVGTTAAGSGAASGLITVQGNASGTPIPVSGTVTATNPSVSATGAAPPASATYIGGSVTTAAPTYTTGQMSALSLTIGGLLRVDGSGSTQPVSGTVTANQGTSPWVTNITQFGSSAVVTGTGASGAGIPRVTVANDSNILATQSGTWTVTATQATAANLRSQTASESTTATATGTVASLTGGAVTTAAPTYTTGQMNPLSLTTTGLLRVDGSGVTQPVSGTVTANAGTGTFTVAGTVTANIGTTNGLALDTTLAKLTIAQSTALGSNTLAMVGGSVTTASPTYTTGNINPLSLTTAGALRIDGSGSTQPVSGTVTSNQGTSPWVTNITQFGSVNISTGTGASGTGIPRVTVANDSNILATQSGTWTVQPGNTANTTPWLASISQGGNTAAVKAASTAAVATDPALVVAISPNNSLTIATGDTTGTGTLNALNATATIVLSGRTSIGMQLVAGTLVGTIVPEVSVDGGTTWVQTFFDDPVTGNKVASIVFGVANTATTRTIVGAGGGSNARVRVSAFTSGTATCNLRTTLVDDPSVLYSGSAGSALAPVIAQVGGSVTTAAPTYTTGTLNALSLTTGGLLRVDSSGTTSPISGTVTANQGTANTLANRWPVIITDGTNTMPTADTAARSSFHRITDGTNTAAVKASSAVPVAADPALVVSISPNSSLIANGGTGYSSTYPDPGSVAGGPEALSVDAFGNLEVRAAVLTDEGSFRDDFSGSGLTTALTGTVTFNNASTVVTGSGTAFTTQLTTNSYIKKTADAETLYVRVASVNSDISVTLESNYTGTTASTTAVASNWKTTTPGTGSITVTGSEVLLAAGVTNGNTVMIQHSGDYLPYTLNVRARITQRVANQTGFIGFQDVPGNPQQQACVVFDGTSNTTVKFRTTASSAAADTQETLVNLSSGLDTSQTLLYEIDLENDQAALIINGTIVATHTNHLPQPYTVLTVVSYLVNAATVTATTLALDLAFFNNLDEVQINNTFAGDPLKVQVISNAATALAGFADGFVALTSNTLNAIRATTYTEPAANAQRSVSSSAAADAAAGTGARTVIITYYTSTGTGPFNETVTLNGTATVNTVSTTICYIEKIVVATVGTGGSNAGTITLFAAAAGAGGAVGTIAIGANKTFWSHHYVQTGKTCFITGFQCNESGSQGALFHIRARANTANSVELPVSDFIRPNSTSNGAGTVVRTYGTPIQIVGPARITSFVQPDQAITANYLASFDFYEQ